MRDYLSIGPTPPEETCVQVGANNYHIQARKECRVYRDQLIRMFGEPPASADVRLKSFLHEFGDYLEVVVMYDDQDEVGLEYALKLEGEGPARWDEAAKIELGIN